MPVLVSTAVILCFLPAVHAQEENKDAPKRAVPVLTEEEREAKLKELMSRDLKHCVVFVPAFEDPDVFVPVREAKKTGMTACSLESGITTYYTRAEFRKLGLSWKAYVKKCRPFLDELLDTLQPHFGRDENGVIDYGQLLSEHPLTASTILSPRFYERFEDKMGIIFYVAIPDRRTVILLPKSDKALMKSYQRIRDSYEMASFPASVELFEVSKNGIRAVAEIPEN